MKHFAFVTLMIVILAGSGASFAQETSRLGDLVIEQPWARASIGTNRPAAAYMKIRNEGTVSDTLMAVSTPLSEMAEVHATSKKDGVMSMGPAGPVEIKPGGNVRLAPGGLHIMMMKLKKALIK
ncbi:MAG: copper chaperone PCu(A)C, partial [Rhodospirillaceae bacterium]|nr:copper chaperone PCu(A)C [Rhodospirillaceae bacterium]